MFSSLLPLCIFVVTAVLLSAVPEWQNNVLMNSDIRGWTGYFETLRLNAVLGLFAYVSFRYLQKRYSPTKTLLLQFTFWGIFGLSFEWFLIGHFPGSGALQYGMFVYWAAVFATPALLILEQAKPIRMKLLAFIFGTAILLVLGSIALLQADPTKGYLLTFTIASWILIYSGIISFFFRSMGYPPKIRRVILVAIGASFAEMLAPFPFNFFVFLVVVFCSYWYVLKRLPQENKLRKV